LKNSCNSLLIAFNNHIGNAYSMHEFLIKLKRKFTPIKISEHLIKETLNYFTPHITGHELKRFGNASDGGYLIPTDYDGVDQCISLGCGGDSSFEDAFGSQIDQNFSIFDDPINFPNDYETSRHSFHPGWIGAFLRPRSSEIPIFSLTTAIEHVATSEFSDGLLKIDIESSEYTSLLTVDEEILKRFRIIVIEFHRVNEIVASSIFCLTLGEVMRKLLNNHMVVHFHANNAVKTFTIEKQSFPSCIEVTLLRRDRIRTSRAVVGKYTHPLDSKNSGFKNSIEVSFPIGRHS